MDDLRQHLPSMTRLLNHAWVQASIQTYGSLLVRRALDAAVSAVRTELESGDDSNPQSAEARILDRLAHSLNTLQLQSVRPVINATGILLHTGLGRAPLSDSAREAVLQAAAACQLEVDPVSGDRNYRGFQVHSLLQPLTGAEDSLIVNNNAGATLLVLQALCQGREVLISRGQLVEIGGSFRLPEIFATAGAQLKEVGTTNRTSLRDYREAISGSTAAILRVHASNYRIIGFTSEPGVAELSALARETGLVMIDDIGSGQLCPTLELQSFAEPDFRSSLAAGADLVLGSGDKLLNGPQSGIILGRSRQVELLRRHPLARCLRIDKLSLAALYATLMSHAASPEHPDLPLYRMLRTPVEELKARAAAICRSLASAGHFSAEVADSLAEVGGGSCAGRILPSTAVAISSDPGAERLSRALRLATPAVWSRTENDRVLLDLRSVRPEDDSRLIQTLLDCLRT